MLSPSPCHPACPPPPSYTCHPSFSGASRKTLYGSQSFPPLLPSLFPAQCCPSLEGASSTFFFWPTPTILQASADQHLPLEASPDAPVPSSVSQFSELCFFLLHICSPHWIGDQFHGDPRECEARAGPCSSWLTYPSALYRAWPIVAAVNIY